MITESWFDSSRDNRLFSSPEIKHRLPRLGIRGAVPPLPHIALQLSLCMLFVLSAYLSGGYIRAMEEDFHPRVSADSAGLCGGFLCPHVGLQNS